MTIDELQSALMSEHQRDKKLTIINAIITVILFVAVASLVLYFGMGDFVKKVYSGDPTVPVYYKILFPVVILFGFGYPIFTVLKLNKRPRQIEELVNELQNGNRVTNIMEQREYKIQIPFLRMVKLYICPVDYFMITMQGNYMKYYRLPVPVESSIEIKTILSNVDIQDVKNVWSEMTETEGNGNVIEEIHETDDSWEEMNETGKN